MHRPTISEIEAGRRRVSAEELREFARLFGVRIGWLAGEEDGLAAGVLELEMAARDMERLKEEDLERVLELIKILSAQGGSPIDE